MIIRPDQLILILALSFFALYVIVLRTALTDRIIYFLLAVIGAIMVINPEMTTHIANQIGIGRGADLLLYLFIITALFYSVGVTAEMRRMRRQLTSVVREIALANPAEGVENTRMMDDAGE